MNPLLGAMLALAVPLRIQELQARGGAQEQDLTWARRWAEEKLGPSGEALLYRITSPSARKAGTDTATMFNELVRAVAVLSFCPGGITIFGEHFEGTMPCPR
jgi:hypothetical protein